MDSSAQKLCEGLVGIKTMLDVIEGLKWRILLFSTPSGEIMWVLWSAVPSVFPLLRAVL